MNKELFKGLEKKEIYVNRKKYMFYVKYDFTQYRRTITFQVDENDNIINVYAGSFSYLDDNILTIDDDYQHCSYYDINTGEVLFNNTDNMRCHSPFINGIAIVYNDKINNYEVLNSKGETIGNCNWLYRVNKNTLLVQHDRNVKTYSLYNSDFTPIKENVTSEYNGTVEYNNDYILCTDSKLKTPHDFYIIDTNGNKVSNVYYELSTSDFKLFRYKLKKEDKVNECEINDLLK